MSISIPDHDLMIANNSIYIGNGVDWNSRYINLSKYKMIIENYMTNLDYIEVLDFRHTRYHIFSRILRMVLPYVK